MERHCDEVSDLLSPYLDHALSSEEEHIVEVHLSHCEACRDELHKLMKLSDALRGQEQIAVPADFMPSLKQRMDTGFQFDVLLKNIVSNPYVYITAGFLVVVVFFHGAFTAGSKNTKSASRASSDVTDEVSAEYGYESAAMSESELSLEYSIPAAAQSLPEPEMESSLIAPIPDLQPKEVIPLPVPVFKSVEVTADAENSLEVASLSTALSYENNSETAREGVEPVQPNPVRRVSETLNSLSAEPVADASAAQKSIVIWDEEEDTVETYSLDDLVGESNYTAAELEHLSAEEQRVLDEALARASEEAGVPIPDESGARQTIKVETDDDFEGRLEPVSKNVIDVSTSDPDMALARFRDAMNAQGLTAMTMNVNEAPYLISLYASRTQIQSLIEACRSSGLDGLEEPTDMPPFGESAIFYVTIDKN
jgi:hypothetical protein